MDEQAKPYGLLLLAALFVVVLLVDVVGGEATLEQSLVLLNCAALCIAIFWSVWVQDRKRVEFFYFLNTEVEAIRAGTARYNGQTITYATRLYDYQLCWSSLWVTYQFFSCPVIHRRWSAVRTSYTLLTFLFGVWAIPWGPLRTYRALSQNLHATGISVGEFLEGVPNAELPPASSARRRS